MITPVKNTLLSSSGTTRNTSFIPQQDLLFQQFRTQLLLKEGKTGFIIADDESSTSNYFFTYYLCDK